MVVGSLLMMVGLGGCAHEWDRLREWERQQAVEAALHDIERGNCEAALPKLERAQSAADLGAFAAESTWRKAVCLGQLARDEESLAHWRLLAEQFPAYPAAHSVDIAAPPRSGPLRRGVSIPRPRYSESARRSDLRGDVVVEYRVDANGAVRDIRVVPPAHPLLASFSIEAVAAIELSDEQRDAAPFAAAGRFRFAEAPVFLDALGGDSAD